MAVFELFSQIIV